MRKKKLINKVKKMVGGSGEKSQKTLIEFLEDDDKITKMPLIKENMKIKLKEMHRR